MNLNSKLIKLLSNNKVLLILSLMVALLIWVMVVINVSPAVTRVVQGVKVNIDTTVPSQFGLETFGETEFTVDVTVKGKKYLISPSALSADDIVVTAQTTNVDSAGKRTLQLKAESASGSNDYTISSISQKTVEVFFDTAKTVEMIIEPDVVTAKSGLVKDGFTTGEINLSETSVTVTGPSTEVNKIEKVVARLKLDAPLTGNKSADAELIALDDAGKDSFDYLVLSTDSVVLTIPVLQVKKAETSVTFKNAPDAYVLAPLSYKINPSSESFKISVDDYDKTTSCSVGTVDFRQLSPTNHVFTFSADDLNLADDSKTKDFVVNVDVSGLSQEYFTVPSTRVKVNSDTKKQYSVSGLNKSVVVVGTDKDLESITVDMITVEVDLSDVDMREGQTVTVPAAVSLNSTNCWIYGNYSVEITL